MRLLPGLTITLLMLLMCSTQHPFQSKSNQYAILDSTQALAALKQCSRATLEAEQGWSPGPKAIANLEADLPKLHLLVSNLCCNEGEHVSKINKYFRQYAGIIVGNQKLIYINAFPKKELKKIPVTDLANEPYIVCDGGTDYWGVIYNPERREFSMLAFNGES